MITGNPLKGQIDYEPDLAGFAFRSFRLSTTDGIDLAAWEFHDQPAPLTFVLIHGWGGMKELLDAQIVFLRRQGWDVVTFDFRNHGHSGGNLTSLGYHETRDLEAVVSYVRSRPDLAQTIFLWGVSMGAVTAIRVAVADPSICGIIAESSYLSLRDTVRRHGRHHFGPVLGKLYPFILLWGRLRAGIDVGALDMERAVARMTEPSALFVAGEEDPRMPPPTARRLWQLCTSPHKHLFIAPRGKHAWLFPENAAAYGREVRRFVDEALARRGRSPFPPERARNAPQPGSSPLHR